MLEAVRREGSVAAVPLAADSIIFGAGCCSGWPTLPLSNSLLTAAPQTWCLFYFVRKLAVGGCCCCVCLCVPDVFHALADVLATRGNAEGVMISGGEWRSSANAAI